MDSSYLTVLALFVTDERHVSAISNPTNCVVLLAKLTARPCRQSCGTTSQFSILLRIVQYGVELLLP
jgi:hypothetical protein